VEVRSSYNVEHNLLIHGMFLTNNEEFYLANIYDPYDNVARQLL
jgi:hypothetical protein